MGRRRVVSRINPAGNSIPGFSGHIQKKGARKNQTLKRMKKGWEAGERRRKKNGVAVILTFSFGFALPSCLLPWAKGFGQTERIQLAIGDDDHDDDDDDDDDGHDFLAAS
jgi:hypothetical protein